MKCFETLIVKFYMAFIVCDWKFGLSETMRGSYDGELGPIECKPMPYEACKYEGYNLTAMPNLVGIELEDEVEYSLDTFKPLVDFGCSSQLQFLLCSLYAPMCDPKVPKPIGPCRPLCEGVRDRCEPVLRGFGYPWPHSLNCSKLSPKNDETHMCMEGPAETVPLPSLSAPPLPSHPSYCAHLAQPQLFIYLNASRWCAPICGANIAFSPDNKSLTGVWMGIWALTTFLIGVFVLSSSVLKANLFKYPDRAAIYVCLSYTLVAIGYLIRLTVGTKAVSCRKDPEVGVLVAITEGGLNTLCVTVFVLLYYFTVAAGVWWVVQTGCWFLRAWHRVTHETFLQYSSLLHTTGWGIPAALTIPCIVLRKIEADELTGTCYVGGHDPHVIVQWVIAPFFLFLIIGTTFIVLSFACFWRRRGNLVQRRLYHKHIDVSVARIGIMGCLYTIPSTCMLGSTFYQFTEGRRWITEIGVRPQVEIFLLKIFMSLAPGLLLGLFLINSSVLTAWKRFWKRLIASGRKRQPLHNEGSLPGNTQVGAEIPLVNGTFHNYPSRDKLSFGKLMQTTM